MRRTSDPAPAIVGCGCLLVTAVAVVLFAGVLAGLFLRIAEKIATL